MLLFIIFGLVVIGRKRVSITRTWKLTGNAAVQFGVAMIVAPIGLWSASREVLPYIVPARILYDPIFGRLAGIVILTIVLLIVAFLLRDKSPQNVDS